MSLQTSMNVDKLIQALGLEPHVEGGYFRQTFQADHRQHLDTDRGRRFTLTSIYYLLTRAYPIGHWHQNRSDIMHYHHLGAPLTYYMINPDGTLETAVLGPDPKQGHCLQLSVRGGVWKASHLMGGEYGLIGEAVVPGFDFEDMVLGKRDELLERFPQHRTLIEIYSRERCDTAERDGHQACNPFFFSFISSASEQRLDTQILFCMTRGLTKSADVSSI